MYKQLQKKDKEIARLSNNSEYYESLLDSSRKENRTLQLTISDLNTSRDSIVQQLNDTKKKLKIKDKNLVQAQTWLARFFHFDFKKDIHRKYTINNSNKLIKVTDTRIIEISK